MKTKKFRDKFSVKNVGKSLVFWVLIFGLALSLTASVNATITPNPNPPTAAGAWPKTVTVGFTFTPGPGSACPQASQWTIYLWEDDGIDEIVSGSKSLGSESVTCGGASCIKTGVFAGAPARPPPVSQTFRISKKTCKYYGWWGGDIDIYALIKVRCAGGIPILQLTKTKLVFIKCNPGKVAYSINPHNVTISQLIEDFNDNYAFYMTIYDGTTTSSSDRVDIPTWISNRVISNNTYNYTIASDITVNLSIAEFNVSCPPGYTMDVSYTPKGKPTITPDHVYLGGTLIIIDLPVEISNTELNVLTITVRSDVNKSDDYNHIVIQKEPQKVLIGQNLEFEGFSALPTVYRLVDGDIVNRYPAEDDYRIYNVNWPTTGAYYVNYRAENDYDAPLLVEDPDIPLKLRRGTKEISSVAQGTGITVYVAGINLFDNDRVDLKIIDPDGTTIKKRNDQKFSNISVGELRANFGNDNINTTNWKIGDYTFQIKTKEEYACGLKKESAVKSLYIAKSTIDIEAEKISVPSLETIRLTVTGVSDHKITVKSESLSPNVIFPVG